MASRRPGPGELLAGASGLLLVLVMFLPWFGLDARVRLPGTGDVITVDGGNLNAWEAFGAIDIVLVVAALLAIALVVVGRVSSPPPALVVAATAAAALAALLIVYRLIDPPELPIVAGGDATYETGRRLGVFFGLLCTAGIAWGAGLVSAAAPEEGGPEPEPAVPEPVAPAPVAGRLGAWTRADIAAARDAAWRRYDRRLGARYARYFEANPELVGEQRTSARDLAASLPPGWADLAELIPEDAWQRQHLSAKSSQTLGVGLLGAAARHDPSLGWLWEALAPLPPAAEAEPRLEFEHVVAPTLLGERPRQTSLDVLVDDPNVVIGLEVKWRQHGIGACLCRGDGVGPLGGERCSRRVEEREAYWDAAREVFGLPAREPGTPCPISPAYEAVRHAAALRALAGPERPAVLALLYDAENPYFAPEDEWPGWPRLLEEAAADGAGGLRVVAVAWQELVPLLPLDDQARAWAAEKHGLE